MVIAAIAKPISLLAMMAGSPVREHTTERPALLIDFLKLAFENWDFYRGSMRFRLDASIGVPYSE
jgi:hypothetical protein